MYFKQQCIFVAVTKSIIQKNSLIIEPHLLLFHRNTNLIPFSGPVLIGGGLMTILFSLEVLYFPHFFKLDTGKTIQAIQKTQIAQLKGKKLNLLQVCFRLHRANKRVLDPDLDNLINPHEVAFPFNFELYFLSKVKHWMDPEIIPYGWGLFREDEEVRRPKSGLCHNLNLPSYPV